MDQWLVHHPATALKALKSCNYVVDVNESGTKVESLATQYDIWHYELLFLPTSLIQRSWNFFSSRTFPRFFSFPQQKREALIKLFCFGEYHRRPSIIDHYFYVSTISLLACNHLNSKMLPLVYSATNLFYSSPIRQRLKNAANELPAAKQQKIIYHFYFSPSCPK